MTVHKAVEDAEIALSVLQNKLLEAESKRRNAEKSKEDANKEAQDIQMELHKQVCDSLLLFLLLYWLRLIRSLNT